MTFTKNIVCRTCLKTNRVPVERMNENPVCGSCKQKLFTGAPVELDQNSFSMVIARSEIPVVVDFWAPWCGPCKMMAPHFGEAAQQLEPDYLLTKLNTQDHPAVAAPFNIAGIPTMVLFQNGIEKARQSGAMNTSQILNWVRSNG